MTHNFQALWLQALWIHKRLSLPPCRAANALLAACAARGGIKSGTGHCTCQQYEGDLITLTRQILMKEEGFGYQYHSSSLNQHCSDLTWLTCAAADRISVRYLDIFEAPDQQHVFWSLTKDYDLRLQTAHEFLSGSAIINY